MIRTAISPRLAIRILPNTGLRLAQPSRSARGGDDQHAVFGAQALVVEVNADHGGGPPARGLVAHLLQGDVARLAKRLLVAAGPTADDVGDAGEKVAEDVRADDRLARHHAERLGHFPAGNPRRRRRQHGLMGPPALVRRGRDLRLTAMSTPAVSPSGFDLSPPSAEERKRLEADLTAEEADVLLHHGTEAPFCGGLLDNKEDGVYCCRLCGLPLFQAHTKFESGTGWPIFWPPFDEAHVVGVRDTSYGMIRIETR